MPHQLARQCLGIALALGAAPAFAQTFVAYAGYRASGQGMKQAGPSEQALRLNGGPSAALGLAWQLDAARELELLVAHQSSTLEVRSGTPSEQIPLKQLQVHLGGTNFVDGQVGRGTYVAGGLGITRFSPGLSGYRSETRASMNLALGHSWPVTPSLALRSELRGYATFVDSSGSFLCSGGCTISIRGNALTQLEATIGLAVSF